MLLAERSDWAREGWGLLDGAAPPPPPGAAAPLTAGCCRSGRGIAAITTDVVFGVAGASASAQRVCVPLCRAPPPRLIDRLAAAAAAGAVRGRRRRRCASRNRSLLLPDVLYGAACIPCGCASARWCRNRDRVKGAKGRRRGQVCYLSRPQHTTHTHQQQCEAANTSRGLHMNTRSERALHSHTKSAYHARNS